MNAPRPAAVVRILRSFAVFAAQDDTLHDTRWDVAWVAANHECPCTLRRHSSGVASGTTRTFT
jgi:hypothetical protein